MAEKIFFPFNQHQPSCTLSKTLSFVHTGFVFSEDEPAALLQNEGGPCAIIAPLQAFILKNLLFQEQPIEEWQQIDGKTYVHDKSSIVIFIMTVKNCQCRCQHQNWRRHLLPPPKKNVS